MFNIKQCTVRGLLNYLTLHTITQTKAAHNHMSDKTSPDNWVYPNPGSYLHCITKTPWKTFLKWLNHYAPVGTRRELTHRLTTYSPTTCHHPTQDSMLICIPLQRRVVSYLPKLGQWQSYLLPPPINSECDTGLHTNRGLPHSSILHFNHNPNCIQLPVSSPVTLMQSKVERSVCLC